MTLRILFADDHAIVREGLKALIQKQRDMRVIAEAEDGRSAVELARTLAPDIIVMDINMPLLNGIEAARRIAALRLPSRIIALSMYRDEAFIRNMFCAGASGYLLKECAGSEIVQAIRAVADGGRYVSPQVAPCVIAGLVSGETAASPQLRLLSAREREILQLIAEGNTSRQIGQRLRLSPRTVETHRKNIMLKLGVASVAGLTRFAVREGIIEP